MNKKLFFIMPLIAFILFAGCASRAKIELDLNPSVGDSYEWVISPEGVVREASRKYIPSTYIPFITGVGGTYRVTFEAIAEGEAEIVVYNRFRGEEPKKVVTYKAVVDSGKKLTLTVWRRHGDGRQAGAGE